MIDSDCTLSPQSGTLQLVLAGPATLDLPRPFGPYELVRQLGAGGMAEVYVARARSVAGFEKIVALKMIHPRLSVDPEFTVLLVEEAKITAQLSHRNIVQLIDLGQVDNTHYIAMEFVDGLDLNKLINIARERKMPVSPRVAAFIGREISDALEHAHKKLGPDGKPLKLVHRDVSPPNILVSTSGEVKLTDFGIAKASMRASKTGTGVVKGKYAYMAPEQAKAQPVDHRADVFALGCVLYELCVGKPVYPDASFPIMLDRVARGVFEPPEKAKPGLAPALVKVIKTALAVKVDERFATARAMADALTEYLFTLPPNPEAELSALIAEFVDAPATPSMPPMGAMDSILDDDFDDSTQIESVAVMKSRMVAPQGIKGLPAAPAVPGFRDEPTRAFKRVEDAKDSLPDIEEEPTAALKGPPDVFAAKPSQNVATLAPPNRSGSVQPEARVRSPGAAQKNLRGPSANMPPPPPSAQPSGPNRDAPTIAPPKGQSSEMPVIPKAGKMPMMTSPNQLGPSVKTPALASKGPPSVKPPALQTPPSPPPSASNVAATKATPGPMPTQSPVAQAMPVSARMPTPAVLPAAQVGVGLNAAVAPMPMPMSGPQMSGPTPPVSTAASGANNGAFISPLPSGPAFAPSTNVPPSAQALSPDPFASSLQPQPTQLAAASEAKPAMLPMILAGGFAVLGIIVLAVVWLVVGR